MALLETLTDNFTTAPVDATKWVSGGGDGTYAVAGGELNLNQTSTSTQVIVNSVDSYTFTNSYLLGKVFHGGFFGVAHYTYLWVTGATGQEYFEIFCDAGTIFFRGSDTAGTMFLNTNVAYSDATMAWWRIRHSGTVVYWETSPDGLTWTIRAQSTYTPVEALFKVRMQTVRAAGAAFTSTFDNINMAPKLVSAIVDDFRTGLDTTVWNTVVSNGTATVSGGYLRLGLTASTSSAEVVTKANNYVLSNNAFYLKVDPPKTNNLYTELVIDNANGNRYARIRFANTSNQILCNATNDAGTGNISTGPAYNATDWAYWRIRHAGTSLFIDRSPDGSTWTQITTGTGYSTWVAAVKITIRLVTVNTTNTPPHLALIDAVNMIGTGPVVEMAPASITDTGTLGTPEAAFAAAPPNPDPAADPDALGDPGSTQIMPSLSTLVESFDVLDPAVWLISNNDQYLTASVVGGQLVFATASGGTNTTHGASVRTQPAGQYYEFAESQITVRAFPLNTHTAPTTLFAVYGSGNGESFYFTKTGTIIAFRGYNAAGTQIGSTSITYDASAHAWWRIRHTAGTVYWETAYTDVGPWTVRLSRVYTPAAGRYYPLMECTWTGVPAAGHSTRFDNINNVPSYSTIDGETLGDPTTLVIGAKIDTLIDAFTDDAIDPTKWTYQVTGYSSAGIQAGQLSLTTNAGMAAPFGETVASVDLYDLRSSAIYGRFTPFQGTNTATYLAVRNPLNSKEFVAIYRQSTSLFVRAFDANGSTLVSTSVTYNATNHAWWQIRHDGTNIIFEVAAAPGAWTAIPAGTSPMTLSTGAMRAQIELTAVSGSTVNAQTLVDNINFDPATRPHPLTDQENHGEPATSFDLSPDTTTTPHSLHDTDTLDPPENLPAQNADPDPAADPDHLGDPQALLGGPPALPDGIHDFDDLGNPAHTFDGDPLGIPDPIDEAETLPDHHATAAGTDLIGVTTDGIEDPEVITYPTASGAYTATPDPLTDPEILTGPALPTPITELEALYDPELFGLLAALQADTPITVGELVDPETLDGPAADDIPYPTTIVDPLTDPEEFGPPDVVAYKGTSNWSYGAGIYGDGIYSGYVPPPDTGQTANWTYGTGTYGYGLYYGLPDTSSPDGEPTLPIVPPAEYRVAQQNLSMGPWSPGVEWRGAPNYQVPPVQRSRMTADQQAQAEAASIGIATGGPTTTRPAMGVPPAARKSFTLRLNEGSEARIDLAMQRGDAVVIDEMDTDIWWRRKDPSTGLLEMIGRFNCAHADLTASDSGVNLSAQFVDYSVLLGDRVILTYKFMPPSGVPETMWPINTPVMDILDWALPLNTGIDMSIVRKRLYNLGTTNGPFELPPGTLISDMMDNLKAHSRQEWEWWVETPDVIDKAPILRFTVGQRGTDKGVTLFDVGSGPTPIASWNRTGASDDYANTLYYTGGGTGTGENAGGGVVVDMPYQIELYGQRDAQDGTSSNGGNIDQITAGAKKKLQTLADRTPTFTIGLALGFWKGRSHIDVGDTVRLILRLGKDVTDVKYRVTEITVDIDENNAEDVTLTLGRPLASTDPRSKRSPFMRIIRKFRNYKAPDGSSTDARSTT